MTTNTTGTSTPGPRRSGAKTGPKAPGAKTPEATAAGARKAGAKVRDAAPATAAAQRAGTYVGDTYDGDLDVTSGGTPTLAHDGEPAGLARVTLAMRRAAGPQAPAPGRLVGLCSWAAMIGIVGFLLAARAGVEMLVGPPGWFLPAAGLVGVAGVACTVAAFFTAGKDIVPWAFLGMATCTLGVAIYLIDVASAATSITVP